MSFGGARCSRVLGAVMNDSLELNVVIGAIGDVDHIAEGMKIPRGELAWTSWIQTSQMVLRPKDQSHFSSLEVFIHVLLQ